MYTSVSDFAPTVAQYIRQHGFGYWAEIFQHVERTLTLTDDDWFALDSNPDQPRWQRIIINLKSNRVLVKQYRDLIQIDGGFATQQYAADNHLQEQTAGSRKGGTRQPRAPRPQKITGQGEKAIRECWNQCFKELGTIYDRDILLADIRNPEMTAVAFGEKYNLTPKLV